MIHVQHKVRRLPIMVRDEVKKLLRVMLESGEIEPVETSNWIAPVVITHKADGKLQFCVDLSSLNQNVVMDNFPLPNINELISMLKAGRIFSNWT